MAQYNIASYNLHGLTQGASLLNDLAKNCDIVLIQEHWLSSDNFTKFHDLLDNCNMVGYITSAMDQHLSTGVLKGRPFGGVGIAFNKKHAGKVKLIKGHESFMIVSIDDYLLVNVYLPCQSNNDDLWMDKYINILASIENEITTFNNNKIIIGGDWNYDLNFPDLYKMHNVVCDFMFNINARFIQVCNKFDCHTYMSTSGACSDIDHFLVSSDILQDCSDVTIFEYGSNLSDHNPIIFAIHASINPRPISVKPDKKPLSTNAPTVPKLRWDKSDLNLYNHVSGNALNNIYIPFKILAKDYSGPDVHTVIDKFYNDITSCLSNAADCSIIKQKKDFCKYWWSQELSSLKQNAIYTFNAWKNAGKPRNCHIFREMYTSKLAYKGAIKAGKRLEKEGISNAMTENLMSHDMKSFWNCWRANFDSKSVASSVDGKYSHIEIANNFADVFSKCNQPNDINKHNELKDSFIDEFSRYSINDLSKINLLNISCIKSCIEKMELGKAIGVDGISAEHLKYAHCSLFEMLSWLFKMMLLHGYVPTLFCKGIVIPLIKDSKASKLSSANYRGITISTSISKVFEMAILQIINPYLTTDFNQFGFKAKSGCRNAISFLKATVQHYTTNGSTVNVCALDIAKAFDRINHFALFSILMKRNVDKFIIIMLQYWLLNSVSCVKWQGSFSDWYAIKAGVRQGGILSPILFNIYIDILFKRLKQLGVGCFIHDLNCSCLLYADDIILLSPSCIALQCLLNVCHNFANDYDLRFNVNKCSYIRIGARYNKYVSDLKLGTEIIKQMNSVLYLGVTILHGKTLSFSYNNVKSNFYRMFNAIYQKFGRYKNEILLMHLLKTVCLPSLLYVIEATMNINSTLKNLDRCIFLAVAKIFKTYSIPIIDSIQLHFNLPKLIVIAEGRRESYFLSLFCNEKFRILTSPSLILFL